MNKSLIIVSTLLIVTGLLTGFLVSQAMIPVANNGTLNVDVTPRNVELAPQQPCEFTAHVYNGTAPYTFHWTYSVYGVNNETLSDNEYLGDSNPITFMFKESAAFANLNVEVRSVTGAVGYATIIVYDPSVFTLASGIYPGSPSYTIYLLSTTYYAKNNYGSNAYSGTNLNTLVETCLGSISSGSIMLSELSFNYSIDIPQNIMVIEQKNGVQRRFINETDTQGSPYTVSTDGTYYFCQDSALSYVNSFTSTNATTVIITACGNGQLTILQNGTYSNLANVTVYGHLKGENRKGVILTFQADCMLKMTDNSYLSDLSVTSGDPDAEGIIEVSGFSNINVERVDISGIHTADGWASAIHVTSDASNVKVNDFTISNCDRGIEVENGANHVYVMNGALDTVPATGTSPLYSIGAHGHPSYGYAFDVHYSNININNSAGLYAGSGTKDVTFSNIYGRLINRSLVLGDETNLLEKSDIQFSIESAYVDMSAGTVRDCEISVASGSTVYYGIRATTGGKCYAQRVNVTSGSGTLNYGIYASTGTIYVSYCNLVGAFANYAFRVDETGTLYADHNTVASKGIWLKASATAIFTENQITAGLTHVLTAGHNGVFRYNTGYITENSISGANTTATTAVINHGLSGTPDYVWCSFNSTAIESYTWTATSTQITVTVTGTLPASWTVYVKCEYVP